MHTRTHKKPQLNQHEAKTKWHSFISVLMRFFIYKHLSEFAMLLASACHTSCIYISWRAFTTASFLGGGWMGKHKHVKRACSGEALIHMCESSLACSANSCMFPRAQHGIMFSFFILSFSLQMIRRAAHSPAINIRSFSRGACRQVWHSWWDLGCDSCFDQNKCSENTDCYKLPVFWLADI